MTRCYLALTVALWMTVLGPVTFGQNRSGTPSAEQLERWLRQYPKADTNGDGKLTVAEAEAYRQRLRNADKRDRDTDTTRKQYRVEYPFATMSDGVKIALAVAYPSGFDPADTQRRLPAMLNMMGYPGATEPDAPGRYDNRYVTVRASLRGSGASGGAITPISRRNGMDGFEIIENWIVKQPWSNGRVALHGHSWGGLTGFMIAATNPPHLRAVAVSGLLDDVYRDIGRIGGIRNAGFPVDWMNQLYLPTGPFDSGSAAMHNRGLSQSAYQQLVAQRPALDFRQSVLWQLLESERIPAVAKAASPGTFATGIRAPIQIMHAWQDEQTGPSGVWLWSLIPDDIPKQLILSNGNHGTVNRFGEARLHWLNHWTLNDDTDADAAPLDTNHRVRVYFETPRGDKPLNQPLATSDFPIPGTQWTRFYLAPGGQLVTAAPRSGEPRAGDRYQVVPAAADEELSHLLYTHQFEHPTALCGPIAVSLWAVCTSLDTDYFVVVADIGPNGKVELLQRGLLRASHRQLDKKLSRFITQNDRSVCIRPRHQHTELAPVVPHQPHHCDIEIYPVGHVFRSGHQLGLWISQPPNADPVVRSGRGGPSYLYASSPPRSTVTVVRSPEHPSSILLPLLPKLPPIAADPPASGSQAGVVAEQF